MHNDIYYDRIFNIPVIPEHHRDLYQDGTTHSIDRRGLHKTIDNHQGASVSNMAGAISTVGVDQTQRAPFKLILGKIVGSSDNEDPYQNFIMNPYNRAKVEGLYVAIACKDLPSDFRQLCLDWRVSQVQNLLGIICKDVLSEDKVRFNKICSGFNKICSGSKSMPEKHYEQMAFAPDISFLLHKYGKTALYRYVDIYSDCCRKAWQHHNQGGITSPDDKDIFTDAAELCYKQLYYPIHELTQPKQDWMQIITSGLDFKRCCSELASSLKISSTASCAIAPVTETFDNIFFNTTDDSNFSYITADNRTGNSVESGTSSFLQRLVNIFCCGVQK